MSPIEALNKFIAYSILIAFVLSVAYILWGGFKFIFSGGDDNKVKQAMGTIRHAIIGLVIVIGAVFIVYIVGQFLGMDIGRHLFNYDEIVNDIRGIIDNLSGNSNLFPGGDSNSIDYSFERDF
ncbi:MAG: pilin [Candidatus Gracilibacteria bacterium]